MATRDDFEYQAFMRSPEAMHGVVRIDRDAQGRIQYRIANRPDVRPFRSLDEAQAYKVQSGLVRSHTFDPSDWRSIADRPRVGPQRWREIERLATGWNKKWEAQGGGFVVRESYDLNEVTADHVRKQLYPDGKLRGVSSIYQGQITTLRFYRHEGGEVVEELFDGVSNFLEESGINLHEGEKTSIRMRAILSDRTSGLTGGDPFTVATFDPKDPKWAERFGRYGEGMDAATRKAALEEAATRASDGQLLGGKAFFRRLQTSLEQEMSELYQYASEHGRTPDGIEARQLAQQYEEIVKQLRRDIPRGMAHTGNLRLGGLELFDVSAAGLDPVQLQNMSKQQAQARMQSIIKNSRGPARESAARVFAMAKGDVFQHDLPDRLGVDIFAASTTITREMGMREAFMTVVPHHYGTNAVFDIGTALAHHGIVPLQELVQYRSELLSRDIASMKTGQLPGGWMRDVQRRMNPLNMPEDPEDLARSLTRTAFDRNLLELHERGYNFMEIPHFAKMMGESMFKSLQRTKRGVDVPNFLMPMSIEAGVSTDMFGEHVQPGEISFVEKTNRWFVHDTDFPAMYRAIGGGDLDDTLANMLRWDENAGRLVVPIIRRPNMRGELSFLTLKEGDHAITKLLSERLDDDHPLNAALRAQREARPELKRAKQEFFAAESEIKELKKQRRGIPRRDVGGRMHMQDLIDQAQERYANLSIQVEELTRPDREIQALIRDQDLLRSNFGPLNDEGLRTLGFVKDPTEGWKYAANITREFHEGTMVGADPILKYVDIETADKIKDPPRLTAQSQVEAMERAIRESNAIGKYTNAGYLVQQFRAYADNETVNEILKARNISIRVVNVEDVIDIARQGGAGARRGIDDYIEDMLSDLMRAHYTLMEEGIETGFDPYLLDRPVDRKGINAEIDRINAERTAANKAPITLESFKLGVEDDKSIVSKMMEEYRKFTEAARTQIDETVASARLPDFIADFKASDRDMRNAKKIRDTYYRALARNNLSEATELDGFLKAARFEEASREVLGAVGGLLEPDDTVGSTAYRAIATLFQQGEGFGIFKALNVGDSNLALRALDHLRGGPQLVEGLSEERVNALTRDITRSDLVGQAGGRVPFSPRAMSQMAAMMSEGADEAFSMEYMRHITSGLEINDRMRDEIRLSSLPDQIRGLFEAPEEGAALIFDDDVLRGPVSPEATIRLKLPGADDYRFMSLGEAVEMAGSDDSLYGQSVWQQISESTQRVARGFHSWRQMFDSASAEAITAASESATAPLRRALDAAYETTIGDPGELKRLQSERSLREATDVIAPSDTGKYSRMSLEGIREFAGTRGGRYAMGAAAFTFATGMIRMATRDRDHTLEDMQGPEHLPGGNPYVGENEMGIPMAPSQPAPPSYAGQSSGVRYEIRGRGGQNDSSLLQAIAEITGAQQVDGTRYNVAPGFQSDGARQRILEQYR